MYQHIFLRILRLPLLVRIFMIAFLVISFFGVVVHIIEPENFPTVFEGVWWAIITASTVGYGDYVPGTTAGRITGILLLLAGTGFLTTYFISLAAAAVTKQSDYIEGKVGYLGSGHLIIVGWNERSREILNVLANSKRKIVLIDESLETNPLTFQNVHFIKGKAQSDKTLLKAKIKHADKVVITSDQSLDEHHADMNTILTLIAVKGLNPDIRCIAEVLTNEQVNNAKRAGADEIIETNLISSEVMLVSIETEGMTNSLHELLNHLNGSQLTFNDAEGKLIDKTFREACETLLDEGTLLIGIKKGESTNVNPPGSTHIQQGDKLLVIIH
nr:potassium channel protein [Mesobacillus harenae]